MTAAGPVIALDAMGGDHGPAELVAGAVAAARQHGARVILAGQEPVLRPLLAALGAAGEIEVAHAPGVIAMSDGGAAAGTRRGTSLAAACALVAAGRAAALVTAGPTGGAVTAAVTQLGCAPGVLRPALAVRLPGPGAGAVLLDAGATADPAPPMLAQFAVLGSAYARTALGIADPAAGLLTIGSEPGKGNRLARRAQPLLAAAPVRFIGNVEGYELLGGRADVIVTDGFTGNVVLKAMEGSLRLAMQQTRSAVGAGLAGRLASAANRGRLRGLARRLDADAQGGAALLGLTAPVVVAHGAARAGAVSQACALAGDLARSAAAGAQHRPVAAAAGTPG